MTGAGAAETLVSETGASQLVLVPQRGVMREACSGSVFLTCQFLYQLLLPG